MTDVDERPTDHRLQEGTTPPTATSEEVATHDGTRRWMFRALGPVLAAAVYLGLPQHADLTLEARTTAAVVVLMAVWWMTEALPLPVTSLVPIVALPLLGVLETAQATEPYASPTVFLFMGGFVIALAMQRWGLHKRIALLTVRTVGTKSRRLVLGIMVATALMSMWVSNTAATLMMLPIGLSVLGLAGARENAESEAEGRRFATCIVIAIAYAATIGGLATLIGSPPTLVMAGFVQDAYGISIGFGSWMLLGVPVAAVFLVLAWLFLTRIAFPLRLKEVAGGDAMLREELARLGRMSAGEWTVLVVFVITALLWVVREPLSGFDALVRLVPLVGHLSDESIAMAAAIALLALPVRGQGGEPVLRWKVAQQQLPWGVLLLFGGGLSLARAVRETGLDAYVGALVGGLDTLPIILLVAAVTAVVLLLTELTSNTATAATFVPVLGGVAMAGGMDPLALLVPAAMAATCAFMLPVGTPPNAIVFATGHVSIGQMARAGLLLNVVGVLLITAATFAVAPLVLGVVL